MPTIKTRDGIELYVKDWGRGRPVVMLHGWPLSADTFDDLGVAVARAGMRAIAYDRRGFGRSAQPWDGYEYDTLATDLADVIQATGATGAALVGFSMGGGEVVRYLAQHTHTVTHAVLIGAVPPFLLKTADNPGGVDGSVFEQMKQGIAADRAAFWKTFFPSFYGSGVLRSPVSAEVIEWSRQVAMQASLKATLDCVDAFGTTDFRPDLAKIRVPTLVVHGTEDATVPIDISGRAAAQAIAGARLVEYAGGPHGLLASHKAEIERDVLAFVAAQRPRTAP